MIAFAELMPTDYLYWLGAAVTYVVVGMVWYSDNLFGKKWSKLTKIKSKKMTTQEMVTWFVMGAVIASVITMFIKHMGVRTILDSVVIVFYAWLGFIVPTRYCDVLCEKKPMELFFIEVCGSLVSYGVMSALLAYGMLRV